VVNLLKNPVFSDNLDGWSHLGSGTATVSSSVRYMAARSVGIITPGSVAWSCLSQYNIPVANNTTYTASGYFLTTGVTGPGAAIEVAIYNNSTGVTSFVFSDRLSGTTDTSINGGWTRLTCSFSVPSGSSLDRVSFGLFSNSGGTVYITGLQLETGGVANQPNMATDSGFERGHGTYGNAHSGTSAKHITGNHGQSSAAWVLNLAGGPGDTYVFGGWAKADSTGGGSFQLKAVITHTDGSVSESVAHFNKNISTWQFASGSLDTRDLASPAKGYTNITLYLDYSNNANTAYFDDLFIYRDNAHAYTWDSNGNLTRATEASALLTSFAYNGSSVARIISVDGTSYEYRYDSAKNPTQITTAQGVAYRVGYDSRGNATKAEQFANSNMTTSLTPGKTYLIRNMATGKYLDVPTGQTSPGTPVVQYTCHGQSSQYFKIEMTGDGYCLIIPQSAPTLCLDVAWGAVTDGTPIQIWNRNNTPGQSFKITPNDDGSYRISTKVTSDVRFFTIAGASQTLGVQVVQIGNGAASDQHWYFEEVRTPRSEVPTDGAVYAIRVAHSGQYLDITGAGTADNTPLVQYRHNASVAQRFQLVSVGSGWYKIVYLNAPGKVLTSLPAVSGTAFRQLVIAPYTGSYTQHYRFNASSYGTYQIEARSPAGYSFDVEGISYALCANIGCYPWQNQPNEQFVFERYSDFVTTSAAYDPTGSYLTSLTDTRGNQISYAYNTQRGLVTSATDPSGTTAYAYDINDRLTSVSSGGYAVNYSYNSSDRLSSISRNNTTYGFLYDSFGNVTSTSVGGQSLVTNTYGAANGNLTSATYGNGASLSYTYDSYNRPISRQWAGTAASTVTYDAFGNIYRSYDGLSGVTTTACYDLVGRPYMTMASDGLKTWVAYDSVNRVASSAYSLPGGTTTKTSWHYGDVQSGQVSSYLYGISLNGVRTTTHTYDTLGRQTSRSLALSSPAGQYTTTYRYLNNPNGTTTALVAGLTNGSEAELSYTYEAGGNITEVRSGSSLICRYSYDSLGQLVRADDVTQNKTITYTYDKGGNITLIKTHLYTLSQSLGSPYQLIEYLYTDAKWKDLLTTIKVYDTTSGLPGTLTDTYSVSYDSIGNPLTWRDNTTLTWSFGRRLSSVSASGLSALYTYNDSGIRTSKTSGGITTTFTLSGTKVLRQSNSNATMDFVHDESGRAIGFKYAGNTYWYVFNLTGDVTGIINNSGTRVVTYTYDTWGKPLSTTGSMAGSIGALNPFRYRGYYYDTETGFYYLNSRYYDPSVGRFLNADSVIYNSKGVLGSNLFAYCLNNPINKVDHNGNKPGDLFYSIDEAAKDSALYMHKSGTFDNDWEYTATIYSVKVNEIRFNIIPIGGYVLKFSRETGFSINYEIISYIYEPYTVKVTMYTYKAIYTDRNSSAVTGHAPPIYRTGVAVVHSHPYSSVHNVEHFSLEDVIAAEKHGVPYYLYTPSGTLRRYDPRDGSDIVIFNDLPPDPRSP
jgi:RHS repeat-associated protein